MTTKWIPLLAGIVLSCAQLTVLSQDSKQEKQEARQKEKAIARAERYQREYPEQFKDHISKQYVIQKSNAGVLAIYNIEGSITVEGYAGDKVLIEVDQTLVAKTKEVLEQGKKEFKLGFEQVGDSVIAYTAEPWDSRPHDWSDRYNRNNDRKIDYRCNLSYTVKVPYNMNLRISTVNDGEILVKDVAGRLHVNNVNGGIAIVNAKNTTWAHTINGDLTVNYLKNPSEASSYYTLNGKLTATFQPGLSADIEFKTMNGGFYTDFPDAELLSPTVTMVKNQERKEGGTVFKLRKDSKLRIGPGGNQFKFETLNGNIYIKKQS